MLREISGGMRVEVVWCGVLWWCVVEGCCGGWCVVGNKSAPGGVVEGRPWSTRGGTVKFTVPFVFTFHRFTIFQQGSGQAVPPLVY